jgi:hypothetical protein
VHGRSLGEDRSKRNGTKDAFENDMANQQHRRDAPDPLEDHSLPGTNQTGKGPGDAEEQEERRATEELPEPLEEHSLPGTNQAGKDVPDRSDG